MKGEGPKVFRLVNSALDFLKIIPFWLALLRLLFLIKSKASCFNYYIRQGCGEKILEESDFTTLVLFVTQAINSPVLDFY